jgi:hypothetical protein
MPESDLPAIVNKNDQDDNLPLIESGDKVTLHDSTIRVTDWVITKRLSQENALAENLTLKLAEILQSGTARHVSTDYRTIPNELAWSKMAKIDNVNSPMASEDLIAKILVSLLILTLLAERTLAFKRNQ